ncbi:MAG: 3-hydroxyacyl-ACP dehydratase FabZ [Alphaproteobacteria bacterium]|nr:3-hydroxyacyl-ACP dehydratase FabZ [Alphaproteobacteria bacterium]
MDSIDKESVISEINIDRIMELIPHRYPFLMIDRIVDVVPGESATGIKNVTINEPCFQGHFPGQPIFPGVLIVEAMAQTSAAMAVITLGEASEGKLVYFMTIENARFRKPVTPGDQLHIHVNRRASRGKVWKFNSQAKVNDDVVAEASYAAMIMDH